MSTAYQHCRTGVQRLQRQGFNAPCLSGSRRCDPGSLRVRRVKAQIIHNRQAGARADKSCQPWRCESNPEAQTAAFPLKALRFFSVGSILSVRHSRAGGNPVWTPVFAGVTLKAGTAESEPNPSCLASGQRPVYPTQLRSYRLEAGAGHSPPSFIPYRVMPP
jgi:hypothetical protein